MADIWSEFKKYLGDALPGGALNPELTTNINESPVPVSMAALRSFLGEAPDELGVSVLHPQRAGIMKAAEPAYWLGLGTQVSPLAGLAKQAVEAAPRTIRNVQRVVRNVPPEQAILDELSRVNLPYERSAFASKRGWVGPVSVGDMGGVSYPSSGILSALAKPSAVGHTHPRTEGYRYAPLSPADKPVLFGQPVDMLVYHTDRQTGAPVGWSEKLAAGDMPPQLSGPTEVSDYVKELMARPGYSTDVPLSMRPSGIMEPEGSAGLMASKPVDYKSPDVDLSRRFFFTMARPAENLPAVVPAVSQSKPVTGALSKIASENTAISQAPMASEAVGGLNQLIDKAAQAPVTRRTILRGILSQALQRFMPKSVVEPVQELAKDVVTQAVSPTPVYSLSPELRAAVYNMPRSAVDWNWDVRMGPSGLLNRASAAANLLKYADQPVVGESGMSLKQALREIKSEPEAYEKFKSTLGALSDTERASVSSFAKNKSDYLNELRKQGYPENIISRESRVWDQKGGKFKPARLPSENSSYPMFDPAHAPYSYDFQELSDIYPEFSDMLKGMTAKQAKQVWSEYAASPEGKAARAALKKYKDQELGVYEMLAKERGIHTPPRYSYLPDELRSYYHNRFKEAGVRIPTYNPGELSVNVDAIKSGSLSKVKAQSPGGYAHGGLAQLKECSCGR